MLTRDVMVKDINYVKNTATINEVANLMKKLDVGAIPVADNGKVIGMLTDRDIVTRAVADEMDTSVETVSKIMTSDNIHEINENEDINKAADLMNKKHVQRLIVKNDNDKIAGIISLADIARNVSDELAGKALSGIKEQTN